MAETHAEMNQTGPSLGTEPLISPQGRRLLVYWSYLWAPVLFIATLIQGTFNPLIGVVIASIGVVFMRFGTSPRRRYYTPLVWAVWFNLGCVISFFDLILNEARFRASPSSTTGAFAFTDGEMWTAIPYLLLGVGAVVAATLLLEKFIARSRSLRRAVPLFRNPQTGVAAICLWSASGIFLALFLSHYEIGRTGMANMTELPFHLAGVLSLARAYLIPCLGILILDILLQGRLYAQARIMLLCILAVGVIGSLAALSRGYIGLLVIALMLYAITNVGRNGVTMASLRRLVIWGFVLLVPMVFYVNVLRTFGFGGQKLDVSKSVVYLRESEFGDVGDMLVELFDMATSRIGGLKELLGTLSTPSAWLPSNPLMMFLDDADRIAWLQKQVLGYVPYGDELVGFGVSFGLWGTLALSGHFSIVFLGTLLFVSLAAIAEEKFFRIGTASVSLTLAVYVGFQFWGFLTISGTWKLIAIIGVIYMVVHRMIKNYGKANQLDGRSGLRPDGTA